MNEILFFVPDCFYEENAFSSMMELSKSIEKLGLDNHVEISCATPEPKGGSSLCFKVTILNGLPLSEIIGKLRETNWDSYSGIYWLNSHGHYSIFQKSNLTD